MENWKKVSFKGKDINDMEKLLVIATLQGTDHGEGPELGDHAGNETKQEIPWLEIGIAATCSIIAIVIVGIIMKKKCSEIRNFNNAGTRNQEMVPLRVTRRPLALQEFRQPDNLCRPTTEEFEKMEMDARSKNITKSKTMATEKPSLNRYLLFLITE